MAALYVDPRGPYAGLERVELWDGARDARTYAGPWPVVAHPPCERWGRYWHGGPSAKVRRVKGDDGGCFEAALRAVRQFGGVLEHPAASSAWAAHGLKRPPGHVAALAAKYAISRWSVWLIATNQRRKAPTYGAWPEASL